jgi:two-component system, LytTR family, sensor kinase
MKWKLLLFLTGFLLFYLLVNFSFSLPNEFDGNSISVLLRNSSLGYWWRLVDIFFWFLLAFVLYMALLNLYPKKKLYCLLLFLVSAAAAYLVRFYVDRMMAGHPIPLNVHLFKNSYFLVCFTLYPVIFFFILYAHYKSIQAKELLLQNRQSELSFLRTQVNPHFLFNSLNNIYSLVYDKSPHALPAIAGLSDLFRYMLYDTTEKVPLEKEIDYINKYIELQKLRFEEPLCIKMDVSGPVKDIYFPPLLLIPFIENAFKHGDLKENEGLHICIKASKEKIEFHCGNKKGNQQKDMAAGIGLQNVKKRLQLLYPDGHALRIKDENEYFTVNLTLFHED